jgi:hypothetical protein
MSASVCLSIRETNLHLLLILLIRKVKQKFLLSEQLLLNTREVNKTRTAEA